MSIDQKVSDRVTGKDFLDPYYAYIMVLLPLIDRLKNAVPLLQSINIQIKKTYQQDIGVVWIDPHAEFTMAYFISYLRNTNFGKWLGQYNYLIPLYLPPVIITSIIESLNWAMSQFYERIGLASNKPNKELNLDPKVLKQGIVFLHNAFHEKTEAKETWNLIKENILKPMKVEWKNDRVRILDEDLQKQIYSMWPNLAFQILERWQGGFGRFAKIKRHILVFMVQSFIKPLLISLFRMLDLEYVNKWAINNLHLEQYGGLPTNAFDDKGEMSEEAKKVLQEYINMTIKFEFLKQTPDFHLILLIRHMLFAYLLVYEAISQFFKIMPNAYFDFYPKVMNVEAEERKKVFEGISKDFFLAFGKISEEGPEQDKPISIIIPPSPYLQ